MGYRKKRCIEASCVDEIEQVLTDATYPGVTVEKGMARVYNLKAPIITVRAEDTFHNKIEVGAGSTRRETLVFIDIFADNDGQRLDLSDILIAGLKNGWNYYEYEDKGETRSLKAGRLSVRTIADTPVNFDVDKSNLDKNDRYRHLISLRVALNIVEE